MKNKIVSGAFWLSAGSIFSRILGVLYLIPWIIMIGKNNINSAQALFNSAYTPYALFISLGTAGFPSAVARRVALYNGSNQYKKSKSIFLSGLIVMGLSGIICSILLFSLSTIIAKNSPVSSYSEAAKAIKIVSPTLTIIPLMSVIRGWFQGNQDLKPFGISQVIEQFTRIIFILSSTYIVIYIFKLKFWIAVQTSVFAAFVGAIFGLLYLCIYYLQHTKSKFEFNKISLAETTALVRLTIYESIPFLLVGSGITITQLIDQIFFKQIMHNILGFTMLKTQYIYTLFSANPNKITTIVIALATSISETSLPLLAANNKLTDKCSTILSQNIEYLLLFLLPVVIILISLSYEINFIFYDKSILGSEYLKVNIIQSLIMGLGINGLTLLQALRYSKKAMLYMCIGLLIKLCFQYPLVYFYQGKGAIWATNLAFCFVCILSYAKLIKLFNIQFSNHFKLLITNAIFFLITNICSKVCSKVFYVNTKISSFYFATILGVAFIFIYIIMLDTFDLSYKDLGHYILIKKYLPRH